MNPTNTESIEIVKERITGMREMVEQTEITDQATFAAVSDKIQKIKQIAKFVREEMEKYTKPAREIITTAQARYLPYEKECKDAEAALKAKAKAFFDAQEAERQRKEAIIARQLENGRIKEDTAIKKLDAIPATPNSVRGEASLLIARKVRIVEIKDPFKVPDEYWIIDEGRVKKAALAGAIIPGVIIREKTDFSSRK